MKKKLRSICVLSTFSLIILFSTTTFAGPIFSCCKKKPDVPGERTRLLDETHKKGSDEPPAVTSDETPAVNSAVTLDELPAVTAAVNSTVTPDEAPSEGSNEAPAVPSESFCLMCLENNKEVLEDKHNYLICNKCVLAMARQGVLIKYNRKRRIGLPPMPGMIQKPRATAEKGRIPQSRYASSVYSGMSGMSGMSGSNVTRSESPRYYRGQGGRKRQYDILNNYTTSSLISQLVEPTIQELSGEELKFQDVFNLISGISINDDKVSSDCQILISFLYIIAGQSARISHRALNRDVEDEVSRCIDFSLRVFQARAERIAGVIYGYETYKKNGKVRRVQTEMDNCLNLTWPISQDDPCIIFIKEEESQFYTDILCKIVYEARLGWPAFENRENAVRYMNLMPSSHEIINIHRYIDEGGNKSENPVAFMVAPRKYTIERAGRL